MSTLSKLDINSKYSEKLVDDICELLSGSAKSIRSCCKHFGISYNAFKMWVNESSATHKPYALTQYARAKQEQISYLAEEILRLTYEMQDLIKGGTTYNETNVNAAVAALRVQIDSLKWILSKLAPKIYGDKLDLTSKGEVLPTSINIILDNGGNCQP
jgi:hypothetical protein